MRYPPSLNMICHQSLMGVCIWSWQQGLYPISILCWIPMAHLGHSVLLAFHEAVHFNLERKRLVNELHGMLLGTLALVPLSIYRHVHRKHHSRLSSPQDAELWPYNQPTAPRWLRIGAAGIELTLGLIFTPLLFLRGILADPPADRRVARRMIGEYGILIAFWATIGAILHTQGWWLQFVVGYLVPAILSGNLQSWRKFIEHMGLLGNTPTTLSRTIVHESTAGRLLATTMLNVSFHGAHHRYGGLPFEELPETTRERLTGNSLLFPSYRAALWAMLPSLADPQVGSQWLSKTQTHREKSVGPDRVGAHAESLYL